MVWHLPGGEAPTLAYLKRLWDSSEPYVVDPHVTDGERRILVNPALAAPPDGTQVALVRRMLLVDDRGAVVPSPLTESIQLRVLSARDQDFFEFRVRRRGLFAGKAGGLQGIRPGDQAYFTFSSHGIDPFEGRPGSGPARLPEILQGCRNCHQPGPAMQSILSVRRLLKPQTLVDSRHARWDRWFNQGIVAAERKIRRSDFGRLQGLWQSTPW